METTFFVGEEHTEESGNARLILDVKQSSFDKFRPSKKRTIVKEQQQFARHQNQAPRFNKNQNLTGSESSKDDPEDKSRSFKDLSNQNEQESRRPLQSSSSENRENGEYKDQTEMQGQSLEQDNSFQSSGDIEFQKKTDADQSIFSQRDEKSPFLSNNQNFCNDLNSTTFHNNGSGVPKLLKNQEQDRGLQARSKSLMAPLETLSSSEQRRIRSVYLDTSFSVQILYINNRVRITTCPHEPIQSLFYRVGKFFELDREDMDRIGLIKRLKPSRFAQVQEVKQLTPEHLYFLVLRLTPSSSTPNNSHIEDQSQASFSGTQLGEGGEQIDCEKSQRRLLSSSGSQKNLGLISEKLSNLTGISADKLNLSFLIKSMQTFMPQIERVKRPRDEMRLLICPFETCHKEFGETGNLKTHMRTHTGQRPFQCSQCDQKFITKGHQQAHELTHTGQKPFSCTFPGCQKKYSRAGRLKIHQRIHTGEKPYACPEATCSRAFRERGNLRSHLRAHARLTHNQHLSRMHQFGGGRRGGQAGIMELQSDSQRHSMMQHHHNQYGSPQDDFQSISRSSRAHHPNASSHSQQQLFFDKATTTPPPYHQLQQQKQPYPSSQGNQQQEHFRISESEESFGQQTKRGEEAPAKQQLQVVAGQYGGGCQERRQQKRQQQQQFQSRQQQQHHHYLPTNDDAPLCCQKEQQQQFHHDTTTANNDDDDDDDDDGGCGIQDLRKSKNCYGVQSQDIQSSYDATNWNHQRRGDTSQSNNNYFDNKNNISRFAHPTYTSQNNNNDNVFVGDQNTRSRYQQVSPLPKNSNNDPTDHHHHHNHHNHNHHNPLQDLRFTPAQNTTQINGILSSSFEQQKEQQQKQFYGQDKDEYGGCSELVVDQMIESRHVQSNSTAASRPYQQGMGMGMGAIDNEVPTGCGQEKSRHRIHNPHKDSNQNYCANEKAQQHTVQQGCDQSYGRFSATSKKNVQTTPITKNQHGENSQFQFGGCQINARGASLLGSEGNGALLPLSEFRALSPAPGTIGGGDQILLSDTTQKHHLVQHVDNMPAQIGQEHHQQYQVTQNYNHMLPTDKNILSPNNLVDISKYSSQQFLLQKGTENVGEANGNTFSGALFHQPPPPVQQPQYFSTSTVLPISSKQGNPETQNAAQLYQKCTNTAADEAADRRDGQQQQFMTFAELLERVNTGGSSTTNQHVPASKMKPNLPLLTASNDQKEMSDNLIQEEQQDDQNQSAELHIENTTSLKRKVGGEMKLKQTEPCLASTYSSSIARGGQNHRVNYQNNSQQNQPPTIIHQDLASQQKESMMTSRFSLKKKPINGNLHQASSVSSCSPSSMEIHRQDEHMIDIGGQDGHLKQVVGSGMGVASFEENSIFNEPVVQNTATNIQNTHHTHLAANDPPPHNQIHLIHSAASQQSKVLDQKKEEVNGKNNGMLVSNELDLDNSPSNISRKSIVSPLSSSVFGQQTRHHPYQNLCQNRADGSTTRKKIATKMNQALNATQTTAADLGSATQKENQNLQLKGIPQSNKSK